MSTHEGVFWPILSALAHGGTAESVESSKRSASPRIGSTAYRLLAASRRTRDTRASWSNLLFVGCPSDDKDFTSPRVSMLARERLPSRDDRSLPSAARRASQLAREKRPSWHENGFPATPRRLLTFSSLARGTTVGAANLGLGLGPLDSFRPAGKRRASQLAISSLASGYHASVMCLSRRGMWRCPGPQMDIARSGVITAISMCYQEEMWRLPGSQMYGISPDTGLSLPSVIVAYQEGHVEVPRDTGYEDIAL
eukprot:gene21202-28109_t